MRIALALILVVVLTLNLHSAGGNESFQLGKTIGSLELIDRTDFEQKELGYNLRYQTKDLLKADVYVYDSGIRNLSDGIKSPEVRKEMESVKGALRTFEAMGKYQHVKELGSGERKFENLNTRFLWARHSYQQSAGKGVAFTGTRISDTFLLVHRGKFIKIRITTKQADLEKHESQMEQFVRAVALQIEKGQTNGAANAKQPFSLEQG